MADWKVRPETVELFQSINMKILFKKSAQEKGKRPSGKLDSDRVTYTKIEELMLHLRISAIFTFV